MKTTIVTILYVLLSSDRIDLSERWAFS